MTCKLLGGEDFLLGFMLHSWNPESHGLLLDGKDDHGVEEGDKMGNELPSVNICKLLLVRAFTKLI